MSTDREAERQAYLEHNQGDWHEIMPGMDYYDLLELVAPMAAVQGALFSAGKYLNRWGKKEPGRKSLDQAHWALDKAAEIIDRISPSNTAQASGGDYGWDRITTDVAREAKGRAMKSILRAQKAIFDGSTTDARTLLIHIGNAQYNIAMIFEYLRQNLPDNTKSTEKGPAI